MNSHTGSLLRYIRSFRGHYQSARDDRAVAREQRINFAPYKKGKNKSWSVKLVCLALKGAKRIPVTAAEREILMASGLGEKQVLVPNINCSWNEFREIILTAFPSLNGCGGFEFLRCVSNTKDLEVIRLSVAQSPKLLKHNYDRYF